MQLLAATFFEPQIPSVPLHGCAQCWPGAPLPGVPACRAPALARLRGVWGSPPGDQRSERPCTADLGLAFHVSHDEEHVQVFMSHGGGLVDMGARAHHYLLLLLARRRLADRAAGNPESACGWIHQEEWDHDPSLASSRVNLDVCRSRMQFSKLGVLDARNIVERRPRSRQLRLGVARLSVIRV